MNIVRETFANGNESKPSGNETRGEEADKASVKDVEMGKEDGKEGEEGKKEGDAGWFGWWGGTKGETAGPASTTTAVKSEAGNGRPSTAPELSKPVEATATPTSPPPEAAPAPVPPPSEPLPIKSTPPPTEPAGDSYLTSWLWGSPRSPPKPGETEPPKPTKEPITKEDIKEHSTAAPAVITTGPPKAPGTLVPNLQNPIISTLPQTKASWVSFWARSDSMPDLKRPALPETMQVPDDVDVQGRPLKKQKTQDDTLVIDSTQTPTSTPLKPPKPTHTPATSISSIPNTPVKPAASPKSDTPSKKDKSKLQPKIPPPPNHVLPDFESIYPTPPSKPSLFSRVTRAILPISSNPTYTVFPGALHSRPQRAHAPPIRRAVAIGIHGFFPLRILRSVLGEPTGTSVKFAALASEAIHRFSEREYGDRAAIEVVKVALEGEGRVADRVNLLWKNLRGNKEWMGHIGEADLILVACHSQGSPVGAGIMARLVEEGVVDCGRTRLGLLCVAGIHLGPAIDVGQRIVIKAYNAIESEAARELYGMVPLLVMVLMVEFQDSDSKVSRKYIEGCSVNLLF
jgi:hypothetical protein